MKLETLCLHGGTQPDPTTLSRAVPVYRTSSYVFKSAEHAANLFALKELGQHLHPPDEPDDRRAREARRAARRRARDRRARPGVGHQRRLLLDHQPGPGRRQHRLGAEPLRRHLHPVQRHPARARDHREVRGLERPAELRPRRSTRRPAPCSARPSRTRRSRSPTSRPSPRSPTTTASRSSWTRPSSTPYLTRPAGPRRGRRGPFADEVVRRARHGHRRGGRR